MTSLNRPPRVLNRQLRAMPAGAVYIGRPSKWGNPFPMGKWTREEVIRFYKKWIMEPEQLHLRVAAKVELKGKDLVCYCSPLACHGDTLLEIANGE